MKKISFDSAPRYRGRTLDVSDAIDSLERKGCVFDGRKINITWAKNLGNKSWGLISFLCRFNHFFCATEDE